MVLVVKTCFYQLGTDPEVIGGQWLEIYIAVMQSFVFVFLVARHNVSAV